MSNFIVLKNAPMPGRGGSVKSSGKYPIDKLVEGGDPLFFPNAKKSLPVTLGKSAKRLGITIATRKITSYVTFDEDGNGTGDLVEGLGVWRIAPKAAGGDAQ